MASKRVNLSSGASRVRVYKSTLEADPNVNDLAFKAIMQVLHTSEFRFGRLLFTISEHKQPSPPARQFLNKLYIYSRMVNELDKREMVLCTIEKWPDRIRGVCHLCLTNLKDIDVTLADPKALRRLEIWFWDIAVTKIRVAAGFRQPKVMDKSSNLLDKLGIAKVEIDESPLP